MKISASILNANLNSLQDEVNSVAQCDRIHLDIMDGEFVDNISFSSHDLEDIIFPLETEVHLMVDNPDTYFEEFEHLGCRGIIFHIENTGKEKALSYLKYLQYQGIRAGLALDLPSSVELIDQELLDHTDQLLIMSVKAGAGGQSFDKTALKKAEFFRTKMHYEGEITFDGGINQETAQKAHEASVTNVVIGSAMMKLAPKHRSDFISKIQNI